MAMKIVAAEFRVAIKIKKRKKHIWKTIKPLPVLKNLRPSVYVPWFMEITSVNCGKSMSTLISVSLLYIKYHIGCLGSFSVVDS